jgi:acyl-CoA thioesterase I
MNRSILSMIMAGFMAVAATAPTSAGTIRLAALGDSLTAGYGLPNESDAFPARLQAALAARGHDVTVVNAGVSGDTAAGGLARLDWSIDQSVEGVIVGLGANDMLRGLDPRTTKASLDAIVERLRARGAEVLVAGMLAAPNLGEEYAAAFNPIFREVAERHDALYYPFFLDGVAAVPSLNLPDGIHPNAAGVDIIVERILPAVEALVARIRQAD